MTEPAPDAGPTLVLPRRALGTAALVAGALLVVLMLFLGLHGPRFVASDSGGDELSVECGSVVAVGWPTDSSFVSSENSRVYGDRVRSGEADSFARDGITRDCAERRGTFLGFMALLAVPASVALSTGLALRRTL